MNIASRELAGNLDRRFGRKWIYLGAGASALIVLLFTLRSCNQTKTPPPPPARPVAVAKVITQDVPLYPRRNRDLCSERKRPGTGAGQRPDCLSAISKMVPYVKTGDLLFTIDKRPYQAALDAAKADNMLAQANLKRQLELQAKDVTATQDLDTAKANAMRTQAAVDAAQVNLDYCSIRSPIDGRAGLRQVDVGNTVTSGSNAWCASWSRSTISIRSTPTSLWPSRIFRSLGAISAVPTLKC